MFDADSFITMHKLDPNLKSCLEHVDTLSCDLEKSFRWLIGNDEWQGLHPTAIISRFFTACFLLAANHDLNSTRRCNILRSMKSVLKIRRSEYFSKTIRTIFFEPSPTEYNLRLIFIEKFEMYKFAIKVAELFDFDIPYVCIDNDSEYQFIYRKLPDENDNKVLIEQNRLYLWKLHPNSVYQIIENISLYKESNRRRVKFDPKTVSYPSDAILPCPQPPPSEPTLYPTTSNLTFYPPSDSALCPTTSNSTLFPTTSNLTSHSLLSGLDVSRESDPVVVAYWRPPGLIVSQSPSSTQLPFETNCSKRRSRDNENLYTDALNKRTNLHRANRR